MLKKFFASLAAFSIIMTSSATTLAQTTAGGTIQSMSIDNELINPGANETAEVTFSVTQSVEIDVIVTDTASNKISTLATKDDLNSGSTSYVWDGTDNTGAVVSDDDYLIKVFTFEPGTFNVSGFGYAEVEVKNEVVVPQAPTVSGFIVASPFNPINETLTIGFTTDQEAEVRVSIKDAAGAMVKVFSDYNGDIYPAGDLSLTWDGTDVLGNVVADGDYTIEVMVSNANGSNTSSATVAVDATPSQNNGPDIFNLAATPDTFNPDTGTTDITFTVDEDAYVTVVVKDGSTEVREFTGYNDGNDFYTLGDFSVTWNGEDDNGNEVSDGTYTVEVTATNADGSDTQTTSVTADDGINPPVGNGIIEDVELDPTDDWNPVDEDLEITFDLTDDSDFLKVVAKNVDTGKTIEIMEEDDVDEGNQETSFDGTEEGGDYIEEGQWEIIITADNSKVVADITVDYDDPEIDEAFVTKDEFDNEQDEFTYLVFKVNEDAIATVEVYDGTKKEETLMDEEDVDKNEWVVVKFDGTDDDGDEQSEGSYEFKITVEGEGEGTDDVLKVDFDIEEDDVSSGKPNATNDYTDPVIFDDDEDTNMEIHFCLDETADVDLNIYDGKSASGKVEAELLDDITFSSGCHTVKWNMDDDDGKMLKKDIYSWKLIAKDGSKKDTETGRFVVGDQGKDKPEPPKPPVEGECGGYWDTQNVGYELCEALDWLQDEGIMTGNPNGSFGPYNSINRAEVLRITLEAFADEVTILPANGSNFGFWDVSPFAWYAS